MPRDLDTSLVVSDLWASLPEDELRVRIADGSLADHLAAGLAQHDELGLTVDELAELAADGAHDADLEMRSADEKAEVDAMTEDDWEQLWADSISPEDLGEINLSHQSEQYDDEDDGPHLYAVPDLEEDADDDADVLTR